MSTQTTTLQPAAVAAARLVADMATTGRLPELIGFSYDFGTLHLHLRNVDDLGWLSDLLGLDPEVTHTEGDSPGLIHHRQERSGDVGQFRVRVHGAWLEPWTGRWVKDGDEPAYRLSVAEAERHEWADWHDTADCEAV